MKIPDIFKELLNQGETASGVNSTLRFILLALVLFTAGNYFANGIWGHLLSNNFDYEVTYKAGKLILQGEGRHIYDEFLAQTERGGIVNNYPVFVAVVFSPLSLFDYETAKILLKLLTQVFVFLSFFLLLRTLGALSPLEKLVCLFLFFNFYPNYYSLYLGQFEFFMLAFLLLFIYNFREGNDALAALFLALAIFLKPFPLLFLPYLAWKREFRISIMLVLILATIGASTLLFVDFEIQKQVYIKTFSNRLLDAFWDNQCIVTFFSRIFTRSQDTRGWIHAPGLRDLLVYAGYMAVFILTGKATIRKTDRKDYRYLLEISFVIINMLILGRITNTHHMVFLSVPFIYTSLAVIRNPSGFSGYHAAALLLSYAFIGTRVALAHRNMDFKVYAFLLKGPQLLLLSMPFYAVMLLWIMNYRMLSSDKT